VPEPTTPGRPSDVDVLHGIGRHAAWTGLQLAAGALGQVAVAAVAVRRMGAGEFGQAALVLAVGGLVAVVDVGLGASVVRTIASRREDHDASRASVQQEVRAAQGIYVMLAFLVMVATLAGSSWAGLVEEPFTDPGTIGFVGAGVMAFVLGAPVVAVATGRRDFRSIAVTNSVGAVVNVSIVYAASSALGSTSVGIGYFVGTSIQRLLLAKHVRRTVPWLSYRPARPRWNTAQPILAYSAPLVLTAAASQLVSASDLVVLSIFSTATAVGLYRLGGALPTWSAGALYRVYDVAFPALLRARTELEQIVALRLLTRFASLAAGTGFGFLAFERVAVVRVVAGDVGPLASDVLAIFAIIWALNAPAHGLALLLTARARHHFLAVVVVGEAVVNIGLSVVLVARWGPIGAALATLVTLLISNLLVLPALATSRVAESWSLVYIEGLRFVAVGASIAAVAVGGAGLVAEGLARMAVGALLATALLPAIGVAMTKPEDRGRLQSVFRAGVPG